MLSDLIVHNFAIIRHLEVSFEPGFNVLSGETGAGKSILVGAVNLVLGSRASQEMIRSGEVEATVEALFHPPEGSALRARLKEWGLQSDGELLIRRTISRSGRNRVFVNNQMVTLQQLQQLAKGLASISGQHEHQLLMDQEVHLDLVDAFGDLEPLCSEVADLYSRWSNTKDSLGKVRRFKKEQAAQLDWMRFQLQELEAAKLEPDEDEALRREMNLLRHAATLREAAQGAYELLYAGRGAILEQLASVDRNLAALCRIDPSQSPLQKLLEEAQIHLGELAHSLERYSHQTSFDPHRLAFVEERLALIQRLGKKYGSTVQEMLQHAEELRQALSQEDDADLREHELEKMLDQLRTDYLEKAVELSSQRREVSARLSREVESALAALDMPHARFAAAFGDLPEETREADDHESSGSVADSAFTPRGIDRVEFLLSANPGEELKPLVRVASGGELSRILLSLKGLLGRKGEAETLIFDEVDAGIGGRTAELVGQQIKKLADRHQVICITHLPQIACYGEHHFKVAKQANEQETVTDIRPLSPEDRLEELARMMGGISVSDKTRAHAREFLDRARDETESGVGGQKPEAGSRKSGI